MPDDGLLSFQIADIVVSYSNLEDDATRRTGDLKDGVDLTAIEALDGFWLVETIQMTQVCRNLHRNIEGLEIVV